MWGHYTDNHRGIVIGFDSNHRFFSKRRSEHDEFGFLRRVEYNPQRPRVILSDTSSLAWFQTKAEQWSYEKEWRILSVLSEAQHRIDCVPFPVCLFEFEADAVVEIIVGMKSAPSTIKKVQEMSIAFPKAALLKACEEPSDYRLMINELK